MPDHPLCYGRRLPAPSPASPFASAEEAWFWFIRCQEVRREGVRLESSGGRTRPCDPDDIYRAVVALARGRTLNSHHLATLAQFGLRNTPPDPRRREEEAAARLWDEALDRLTTVLRRKGIVE